MSFSIHFNEERQVWISKCKKPDGKWTTKFLPKKFERRHEVEAEQWFIQWYAQFLGKATVAVPHSGKTIASLHQRWLKLRYEDSTGTKMNTYRGLESSMKNWILDNDKFKHYSIQNVELEKDFTVNITRSWIQSLQGEHSTRLQHINTLRAFFRDCIGNEWLDGEMTSPLEKLPIKKLINEMAASKVRETETAQFTLEQVQHLFGTSHRKVKDWRRVRYLIAVTTGMRDAEIQALVWKDIHLDDVPYLSVERQLDKIGKKPFQRYEDLVLQGMDKDKISKIPNALVSNPKYHSIRVLPLHGLTALVLKWWKEKGWALETGRKPLADDPVLPRNKIGLRKGQKGGDFTLVNDCSTTLRLDLTRVGLPETEGKASYTFHAFRRTWMTLLEAAGVSEERISILAGHKGKTVARRNYIRTQLASFAQDIALLPLDTMALDRVTLTTSVESANNVKSTKRSSHKNR